MNPFFFKVAGEWTKSCRHWMYSVDSLGGCSSAAPPSNSIACCILMAMNRVGKWTKQRNCNPFQTGCKDAEIQSRRIEYNSSDACRRRVVGEMKCIHTLGSAAVPKVGF